MHGQEGVDYFPGNPKNYVTSKHSKTLQVVHNSTGRPLHFSTGTGTSPPRTAYAFD
jgi:hypothetical protein